MVNVTIYSIHGSYGLCIYQIIKIGPFPPSSYSAPPARGTFPSRHQTENSWLRNEGFTVCREPGLQWFPRRNSNRTPIQPGIIWGYLGIILGLFGDYFGYILGMPLGESTNQPIPDLSSLDIRLLRDDRTTPRPVVGNER